MKKMFNEIIIMENKVKGYDLNLELHCEYSIEHDYLIGDYGDLRNVFHDCGINIQDYIIDNIKVFSERRNKYVSISKKLYNYIENNLPDIKNEFNISYALNLSEINTEFLKYKLNFQYEG